MAIASVASAAKAGLETPINTLPLRKRASDDENTVIQTAYFPAILVIAVGLASAAEAQGLLDKVADGVGNVTRKMAETVDSTVDLIAEDGTPAEIRAEIDTMAAQALERAFKEAPGSRDRYDESAGFAIFDARNLTLGVAAGYGRGVAVSRTTGERTYMRMGTGGVGFQFGLGGFATKVVILFETEAGFNDFVVNGYDGTVAGQAMVVDEKANEAVRFVDGRSILVLSDKGLMVNVSATGTKYWTDQKLNQY